MAKDKVKDKDKVTIEGQKYNAIEDTPRQDETLVATDKADAFIFDAAAVDDDPNWSSGGHVQTDSIVGFEQGEDIIAFENTYYAIPGELQGRAPNQILYNNDVGLTDWDSEVLVYDDQNNPVNLTEADIFII